MLLLLSMAAAAEPAVTLLLVDAEGGEPVPEVTLLLGEHRRRSDSQGRVSLDGVPAGVYWLELQSAGWRSPPQRITVREGEPELISISLWSLDARGVHGGEAPGPWELREEDLPGALGDSLRALSMLPGVSRPPLGSAWPLLRGSSPHHSLYSLDGLRIPRLLHLGGYGSLLPSAWVQSLDAAPWLSPRGPAGSGVELRLQPGLPAEDLRVDMGLSLLTGGLRWAPEASPRWQLSARRSVLTEALEASGVLDEAGALPSFLDLGVVRETPQSRSLGLVYLDEARVPAGEAGAWVRWRDAGARAQTRWLGEQHELAAAWTWERLSWESQSWQSRDSHHLQLQALADWDLGALGGSAGADLTLGDHLLGSGQSEEPTLWIRRWTLSPEPFLSLSLQPRSWVLLEGGARSLSWWSDGQPWRHGVQPWAQSSWKRADMTLSLGWSRGLSPPPLDLALRYPLGASLGLDERRELWLQLRGGGSIGWQLLAWDGQGEQVGLEQDGSMVPIEETQRGIEASLGQQRALTRWTVQARWSESQQQEPGSSALILPSPWIPSWELDQLASWQLLPAWSLQERLVWQAGSVPPPEGSTLLDPLTGEQLDDPQLLQPRPGLQWDLGLRWTWREQRWQGNLTLECLNLLNQRLPEPVWVRGEQGSPSYLLGLPRLWSLGVQLQRRP